MKKILFTVVLTVALVSLLGGCTSYKITRFEDHITKPITVLEVVKVTSYGVSSKAVHQFYLCKDEKDALVCDIRCDGKNDISCPSFDIGAYSVTTNVR